ncbi:HPC2 multi-domain protein, partial [Streptomyces sp. NPDC018031]
LAGKVRQVFQAAARPVNRAIDKLVDLIAKQGKKLWAKIKGKIRGGDDSPQGKQQRLDKAMSAAVAATSRFSNRFVAKAVLSPLLSAIRIRYRLTSLKPVANGERWEVHGEINPKAKKTLEARRESAILGEMRRYRTRSADDTFNDAEKDELDSLIKRTEGGTLKPETAKHLYQKLIERSKARRENYIAAKKGPEKEHKVTDEDTGKKMDDVEKERKDLKDKRSTLNITRRSLAAKFGYDDPDKVDDKFLSKHKRKGPQARADAEKFELANRQYKTLGNQLNSKSEDLGVLAADDFAKSKGASLLSAGPKGTPGTLDMVYYKPGPPRVLLVCEAKGGSSELGTKSIGGTSYQQGTPEYLQWMIKNDSGFRENAKKMGLLDLIDKGKVPVEYHLVQAPGGRKVLVSQFDLTPDT